MIGHFDGPASAPASRVFAFPGAGDGGDTGERPRFWYGAVLERGA